MPPAVEDLVAALITVFEGCRLTAYQDSGGVWTVGFGHTGEIWPGEPVGPGTTITMEQATDLLRADAAPLLRLVLGKSPVAAAAYVSFGYNCGAAALGRVLAGQAQMDQFVHDHAGNVLPGLVARRALESLLATC